MLYLFVGVFKLISLSPGENSNCLPGVKGDDKGKERGGRPRGGERNGERVKETHRKRKLLSGRSSAANLNMLKKHVLTRTISKPAPMHAFVFDSETDHY